MINKIDENEELTIEKEGNYQYLVDSSGYRKYEKDITFIPKIGSIYSKPSFANQQIKLGKLRDGSTVFSNGVWFMIEYEIKSAAEPVSNRQNLKVT